MDDIKYAYSTLPDLLLQWKLSVTEVHRRLRARGFRFDIKTLYRLASHEPIQTINAPVVGAVCEEFKIGLDDLLVWQKPKQKLHRIDHKMQARLDELMTKNTEGTLSGKEKKEFAALGETVERLSLENARILAMQTELNRRSKAARRTAIARVRPAALSRQHA